MFTSDLEVEKTEFHDKYRYSSLVRQDERREMLAVFLILLYTQNHLATPAGERRCQSIQVSGRGLDQVRSNMAGIQNSILNTSSNTTNNTTNTNNTTTTTNNNNTIIELR